jgi:phosphate transport system permease protein
LPARSTERLARKNQVTTLPIQDASAAEAAPRKISRKATGADKVFVSSIRVVGSVVLVITGGVGVFLGWQALPTLRHYGFGFFTESAWQPEADVLGTALYISEYAPARMRSLLVSLVDLMAAVPSIIWGLWGSYLIMEHAAALAMWLDRNLGFIPIFEVKDADPNAAVPMLSRYSFSMFVAGIAVAMMVLPMACAVMRQVFSQTPQGEKEAALALGATRWGMVRSVVIPFGRGGIIGGAMLGLGRALGETIAVLLILSPSFEVKPRILEIGGNTVSALIAGRFGDASASQLSALLAAGFVLFLITLVINTIAATIVNRSRSGAGTDA